MRARLLTLLALFSCQYQSYALTRGKVQLDTTWQEFSGTVTLPTYGMYGGVAIPLPAGYAIPEDLSTKWPAAFVELATGDRVSFEGQAVTQGGQVLQLACGGYLLGKESRLSCEFPLAYSGVGVSRVRLRSTRPITVDSLYWERMPDPLI